MSSNNLAMSAFHSIQPTGPAAGFDCKFNPVILGQIQTAADNAARMMSGLYQLDSRGGSASARGS
jgi:hypothetical protein